MSKTKNIILLTIAISIVIVSVSYIYYNQIKLHKDFENRATQTEAATTNKKVIKKNYIEQVNNKINMNQYPHRLAIPLILQTDKQWSDTFYGIQSSNNENNSIKINGCAIVSLSMVASYLENKEISPLEILAWSGNTYFIENQGTSWNIFSDFAATNGYQMVNLGNDFESVKEQLASDHPVIISVKPGKFTEVGHIMVVSGYNPNEDTFWLNDPNDSEEKQHSTTAFSQTELEPEVVNFWSFYK